MEDICNRYLPALEFRKAGQRLTARCPFHDDRDPSLVIFSNGRFKCFGCGVGGDGVQLVALAMGVRPLGAARQICRDFGLPVAGPVSPAARQKAQEAWNKAIIEHAFNRRVDEVYDRVAMLYRCIFKLLRTAQDYERYADMVHWQPQLEYLLDELASKSPARRVEGLRAARRWVG
ncbi:MAG: hypothetical protein C4589_03005 [Peptococcaceae bacterium]|nr:MAG: hypothetical protein C4589_03005 [Peptococcaceae bacterium]